MNDAVGALTRLVLMGGILLATAIGGGGCFAHRSRAEAARASPGEERAAAAFLEPSPGDDGLARDYLRRAVDLRERGAEALVVGFDFSSLRRGYVHALAAHPELAVPEALRSRLAAAIDGNAAPEVLRAARAILDRDVTDTRAHVISALVLEQIGRAAEANFHRVVAAGLFASMRSSGDGRALSSAYVVYQLKEEYELLRVLTLAPIRQRFVSDGGRHYDEVRASDANNPAAPPVILYFDVNELPTDEGHLVVTSVS